MSLTMGIRAYGKSLPNMNIVVHKYGEGIKRGEHVLEQISEKEDIAYADAVKRGDMETGEKQKGSDSKSGVYTAPAPAQDRTPTASAKTTALKTVESIADGIAKVKQARIATKKILSDLDSKPIGIENVVSILSNRLHAKPIGARSRYRTYALDFATEDGQTFTLRLSDHSAHASAFVGATLTPSPPA